MQFAAVLVIFFVSGASALIFEGIWVRYLTLTFGATHLAISTVLTVFMGGLALGSWLFGKYADRIKHPLLLYGAAEFVTGIFCFVVPPVVHNVFTAIPLPVEGWWLGFMRFLMCGLLLIIPTTAMGATLPLLAKHFTPERLSSGRMTSRIGTLYSINTFGAVFGIFLSTFFLMQTIGLAWTNRTAGMLNLSIAAIVFLFRNQLLGTNMTLKEAIASLRLGPPPDGGSVGARERKGGRKSKREELEREAEETDDADEEFEPEDVGPFGRKAALAAICVAGISAMIYEVVWARALAMVLGSSVYSFGIILMAFLTGLALGSSIIASFVRRIKRPMLWLAMVQAGIGITGIFVYLYMDDLPIWFAKLVVKFQPYENNVGTIQAIGYAIAALAVFPPTIFMGMSFPLTVRIWTRGAGKVGSDVGTVYSMNTLGNIVGSFAAGFILTSLLGMEVTFRIAIGLNMLMALLIVLAMEGQGVMRYVLAPVVPVLSAVAFFVMPGWDPVTMTLGVFRLSLAEDVIDPDVWGEPDLIYYRDGLATTVTVERWGRHYAMKNNGKVDASNGDDMPTQIMVAGYPLLLHPRGPRDLEVAVIGFGSGVTVGTALQFPVRHVDAIELERNILEASQFFADVNHLQYDLDEWPYVTDQGGRLTVINNDGRNYLASTDKKYDVIISEPSNPWITGVANLFTVEHFRRASQQLKRGGIFCQWVQLYELSPENIRTVFHTFSEVFPHVQIYAAEDLSSDTVVLGSFDPLPMDLGRVQRSFAEPGAAAALEQAYIYRPYDVFARVLLASRREVREYTSGSHLNTDDNARIEFNAPRNLIEYRKYEGYLGTIYSPDWPYGRLQDVLAGFGTGDVAAANYAEMALSLIGNGKKGMATHFIRMSNDAGRSDLAILALDVLDNLISGRDEPPLPLESPVPGPGLSEDMIRQLHGGYDRAREALATGAYANALEAVQAIPEPVRQHAGPGLRLMHGYLLYKVSSNENPMFTDAITELQGVVEDEADFTRTHPEVYYYLGRSHDGDFNFDKALRNMRVYIETARARTAPPAAATTEGGAEGTATTDAEAPAGAATSTDAEGESPKEERVP